MHSAERHSPGREGGGRAVVGNLSGCVLGISIACVWELESLYGGLGETAKVWWYGEVVQQ